MEGRKELKLNDGGQTEFFLCTARHPGFFAGRGAGKTVAAVAKAFGYILQHPGARGVITSPTYDMIERNILPVTYQLFGELHGVAWEYRPGTQRIIFSPAFWGGQANPRLVEQSVIYLRPADYPERLRGMTLAFFAMDEVAQGHQHQAFIILQGALRQKGYPQQGWVTSTPSRSCAWVRQRWVEHRNPFTGAQLNPADYPSFFASAYDNPHIPKESVDQFLASLGDTRLAAQEIFGQFIAIEGAAFPQFSEAQHVVTPPAGLMTRRAVVGLDFGGTNPTALIEVCQDTDGRLWATREFYKAQCDDREWVQTVREWNAMRIVCDPSGGYKKIDWLRKLYGVPIYLAKTNDFATRARLVGSRLNPAEDGRPGLLISPACPNLIAELKTLAYHQPQGRDYFQDRWEPGAADHAYDALAYAIMDIDMGMPDYSYQVDVRFKGWDY